MIGINTNSASLVAQKNLVSNSAGLQNSIARLSSGLRVNSARDDAAGLAIATRMSADTRGMEVAKRNANDGISALQVADGTLGSISDNLQRMRELAVQSATGTLTASDRTNLDAEFQSLAAEVTDQADKANFNGVKLLDGTTTSLTIQTGSKTGDTIAVNLTNANTAVAATAAGDVTTVANANTAMTNIDTALDTLNAGRAVLGAGINRLDAAVSNLSTTITNLSAARGRIMDADFASETASLTRSQILQQAGTAMLAQANQLPNNVLSLLK